MKQRVLVLAEFKEGKLRNVSLEALAAAMHLSRGGTIGALVIGQQPEEEIARLGHGGADHILQMKHDRLSCYTSDGYVQALEQAIEAWAPDALVFGHTGIGKDLAPRLAARLQCGLVTDCVKIQVEEEGFSFVRPIYSGKAFETRRFISGRLFVTIRPNNIKPLPQDTARTPTVETLEVEIQSELLRTMVKDIVRKSGSAVDLSEAKIVVSGGRGVKSKEGFQTLQELADVLGAAIGASRGACDAGYCDYALQIGQTGKVITPELYIACGISGAIQHLAGMSGSRYIVAINTDPDAPIFGVADLGIVGDLFEVVPMLTQAFKQLKQSTV